MIDPNPLLSNSQPDDRSCAVLVSILLSVTRLHRASLLRFHPYPNLPIPLAADMEVICYCLPHVRTFCLILSYLDLCGVYLKSHISLFDEEENDCERRGEWRTGGRWHEIGLWMELLKRLG